MEGIQYRIEPESLLDEHDFIQSNMRTTSRGVQATQPNLHYMHAKNW